MNNIYTINELPKCHFGDEYSIFCFEVLNGVTPLALHIGKSKDNIITIVELDRLHGYFDNDRLYFHEDKHSYSLFIDFLKSISLKPNVSELPMTYDVEYAKNHFYVDMRVN